MTKLLFLLMAATMLFAGCTETEQDMEDKVDDSVVDQEGDMTDGEGEGTDEGTGDMGSYKSGTYTATADGYGGDVVVEMTFTSDKITQVTVTGESETENIGTNALNELPSDIMEKQTHEVDHVAGATVTSEAIKTAAKDCIDQAKA